MLPLGTRRLKLSRERIIAASGPGLAVFTAHQMLSLTCSSSSCSTLQPWGLDPGELFCKGLGRVPSLNKGPRWELLRKAETLCSCPAKCIIPGLKRFFPSPFSLPLKLKQTWQSYSMESLSVGGRHQISGDTGCQQLWTSLFILYLPWEQAVQADQSWQRGMTKQKAGSCSESQSGDVQITVVALHSLPAVEQLWCEKREAVFEELAPTKLGRGAVARVWWAGGDRRGWLPPLFPSCNCSLLPPH